MTLHRHELAPALAERLFAALAEPSEPETPARPRRSRIALCVLATLLLWFVGLMAMGLLVQNKAHDLWVFLAFAISLIGAPILALQWTDLWPRRRSARVDQAAGDRLSGPQLEKARATLSAWGTLDDRESAYLQALARLLELADTDRLDEAQARATLHQMNALLAADADLAAQARRIDESVQDSQLEARRAALIDQHDRTTDPTARAALERSITACDTQIANAAAMDIQRERIVAQREAVHQTLQSLESTLTRRRVSPAGGPADTLDLDRLQQTVAALAQESASVEQAVAEVDRL